MRLALRPIVLDGLVPGAGGGGGPPAYVGPLDPYLTGLWAAISFNKKLRSTYGGNARTTRRSSDNVHVNVPFNGGAVDLPTETAFCAGTNGFVVTAYGQEGANNDFSAFDNARQPRTVLAGVSESYGMVFANQAMFGITNSGIVAAITVFAKFNITTLGSDGLFFEHSPNAGTQDGFYIGYVSGVLRVLLTRSAGSLGVRKDYPIATIDGSVMCFRFDMTETGLDRVKVYKAGVLQTPSATQNDPGVAGNFANERLYVGGRGAASLFAPMRLQHLAAYTGAAGKSDADIAAISAALA